MKIVEKIKEGDIRATARLITMVERRDPEAIRLIREIYPRCGRAHLIGITGPPGVGKSCMVSELVKRFRQRQRTVGVLAVDPSSPFSGGAFLGDRARMIELSGDKGVFIRSLASRGAQGGLSVAVNDAADILDVFGKDVILIETVGVGQGEVDIARLAHTVVLAMMPGCGDTLQAMKAGIMEIADIMVVNKADKPGADATVTDLLSAQHLQCSDPDEEKWAPPIIKTSATTGEGIDDLVRVICHHFEYIKEHNILRKKDIERRTRQFLDILTQTIRDEFMSGLKADPGIQKWVEKIGNLELDPYSASEQVIDLIKEAREQKKQKVRDGKPAEQEASDSAV
ncbi:MAG: methylmalonyl Co-A mutase-associated GTPase MeaB [Deltaproteobacteria bacterium]|nr:methylmalonyl Co-A mutase-associated GTPase MeaB [Deltaproteobacteria bacterium]